MSRYADVPRSEVGLLWTERWRRGWQKQNNNKSNKQAPGCTPTRRMSLVTQILCCPSGCRPRVGRAQWPYDHPAASWFNFLPLEPAERHLSAPHYYPPSMSSFSFIQFHERLNFFPPPLLLDPPQSLAKRGLLRYVCVWGGGVRGGGRFRESERKLNADPEQPSSFRLSLQAPDSRFAGTGAHRCVLGAGGEA